MPGFLYYLPNVNTTSSTELLKAADGMGVAYAFDGRCFGRACHRGPDGGMGMVCAAREGAIGYHAEKQEWRKIPGSAVWVGKERSGAIGPDDLARNEQLSGHWVKLMDGHSWLCPVARGAADSDDSVSWYVALPAALSLSDDGRWVSGKVESRYRHLWELAVAFLDAFTGATNGDGESVQFDFQGLPDGAVACLSANYRLGRVEASWLGLFDDKGGRATEVLQALIDWPSWQAILKKKLQAEASNTSAG